MLFNTGLAVAAAAAALVSAAPTAEPTTLDVTQILSVTNIKNVVLRGQKRLAEINKGQSATFSPQASGPATNDIVTYTAPISIGGKIWNLIVDTGSSNTWCGAQKQCEPTTSGRSTNGAASVTYGSGSFDGTQYTDKVAYAGLSVARQSISAASRSMGFPSFVDGIVGFGPLNLTFRTVSNAYTIPTFMNNLYTQGSIANEVLGVYFKPISGSAQNETNGCLTLGGADATKYNAPLTYFPLLADGSTASFYWGISISSFRYGPSTTLGGATVGIVDTGTTLIYVPTPVFNNFLANTGGSVDPNTGLVIFNTKPTKNFVITFGTIAYPLTPAQYLVPQAQYAAFGLNPSKFYAWIGDGGNQGVNTIVGQKFLETYYSVYDTTNSRIGFAKRK